jgi:DNA-binding transcriptional ArsR family regulator
MRACAYSDMQSFSSEQIDLIAARSRALGDGTRVRILTVLQRGEQAVGQIAEAAGTQPSTASKHLQVLFHAGLVQRRRSAATVLYRISSRDLLKWLRYLGGRREQKKATPPRMGTLRTTSTAPPSGRARR